MASSKALTQTTDNTLFSNAVIDSLPGIFYIFDHSGKFLKWNKNFEKAIGYNTTELSKKQPLVFFKTQAKTHVATQQKRRHQTESVDTITSKSGKKTRYHFTVNTITYNEQECIAVNGIDITKQIEDQRQLTLSKNTLDGLFNSAPLGMAILSITRRWIKVNNKLCTMLGYSEKEMLSMSYDDIADPIHKKDNEETYRKFEKKIIGSYTTERIFIKKDGTQVWVNLTMSLIEDRIGVPIYYISQLEDITEKKKTLKELSDYKIALDESSIVAITDPKCIINYVNDNFCKIAGYDCEELVGQGHGLINSTYNPKKFVKQLLETISNSIKYSRVDIKTHIEISSKKNVGSIMLKFKDNGMGIDAKQLEELFGLYKRFHTSVAEGKGIGLYITKTQIESIGGFIKVKSKVNSGTEFNIQLPL